MKFTSLLFFLFISCRFAYSAYDLRPGLRSITIGPLAGQEYFLSRDRQKICSISYVKVPLWNWYILFDFYTTKQFRNRGYGRMLLNHVLQDLEAAGATKIYIQPGPFDIVNGKAVQILGPERGLAITRLIRFYESCNFRLVNSKLIELPLKIAYKVLSIEENPAFLMVAYPHCLVL